jgi:hypothetical protein
MPIHGGISGASATRILEATIIIPPEEAEEMDKVETTGRGN